jgi:O-antigen ligase
LDVTPHPAVPVAAAGDTARGRALAGTGAVVLMLAATRWGSYIGLSPLYLTDALVAVAVCGMLMFPGQRLARQSGYLRPPLLVIVFLCYVVVRMMSSGSWVLTQTWLRDGAPYLYAVLALMAGASVARTTALDRQRTMVWIWRGLVFHLLWMCAVAFLGDPAKLAAPHTPFAQGLFSIRPDIDTAILGVTGGLLLRRILIGEARGRGFVVLGLVIATLTHESTRAGLIAVLVCLVVTFMYAYAATHNQALRRVGMVLVVPLVIAAAIAAVPTTKAGARLLGTIQPSTVTTTSQENAIGTSHARRLVWHGVISWTLASRSRALYGVGMGTDFLAESDTLRYLEGTTYQNVRSPHDYFVGSFARLGLVGLALILALMVRLLRQMLRHRRRIGEDELLTCSSLIVVAIAVVASFGVVLEAPFGAVPFWWAAGILLVLTRQPYDEQEEDLPKMAIAGNLGQVSPA